MEAFHEGYAAYLAGVSIDTNPYPLGTEDRHEWVLGYNCAHADATYD